IDPLGEGYDLVVRANPLPTTELAGRCFLRDELILTAPPALSRTSAEANGVAIPAVVLSGAPVTGSWSLTESGGVVSLGYQAVLQLSSMVMVYDAVLAGAGAALLPRSLVQANIDAGTLVDWGTVVGRRIEVWALYPPHRHVSRKVSAFVQMLIEHFVDGSPAAFRTLASSTD
ncbi:MAG: LysR substrate-binding domain-containing protein, partial [Rhodanobacter sp.]